MSGRRRGSAGARARLAGALLRGYLVLGGPVVAVALFLAGVGIWWVLGWLGVWLAVAKVYGRLVDV